MSEKQSTIYQFHLTVAEISPLIWRRIWIRADQTLADLHYTIQITLDWTDSYLSHFHLRGENYCVYKPGGLIMEEADEFSLQELKLRPNECFQYKYNMYVPWQVKIRYEKLVPLQANLIYPYCVAGKQPGPLEICASPDAYQARRNYYNEVNLGLCVRDAYYERDDEYAMEVFEEQLDQFQFWLYDHHFDRKSVNESLETYSIDGEWWIEL